MFFLALIIVLSLLAIKLLYNYFTHPKAPLAIVNNKMVAPIVTKKFVYKFKYKELKAVPEFVIGDVIAPEEVKATPPKSGNFSGANKRLFIYNQGPDIFNVTGISYFAKPRITSTTNIITSVKRVREDTTSSDYLGGPAEINVNEEIELQGIDDYTVARLLISTSNSKERNLTVYVYNNTTKMYTIVTLGPFDKNFLLIDLYD